MPGDQTYFDAFHDLSSMRRFEGGPIPFDKILWYAVEILWLDPATVEIFTAVMREMDMVYQEWLQKEQEKGKPGDKSSPSSGAKRPTRPRTARRPARRR